MIYAMTRRDISDAARLAIAHAIQHRDSHTIELYVVSGDIVHVMAFPTEEAVSSERELFCIFCRIPVFSTDARAPGWCPAKNPWHFEHRRTGYMPGDCVGRTRNPPIPHALGIENPADHGCYVLLGCEVNANGMPSERHRTRCQTIDLGRTYCHLAVAVRPRCI
jgi:hypothetical protein